MTGRLLSQLAAQAPSFYLQQGLNGLFSGSVYALFAVGYTLVFGVLDILNLAHSAVFMAGAVVAFILFANFGLPFWVAVLVAIAICGAIGYGLDLVAFRPLRRRSAPHISSLITSIAIALIFVSLAENKFGANSQRYPEAVAPEGSFHVGGVAIDQLSVLILLLTLGLMVVLAVVIRRTRPGRAIRAVAENPRAAALMGINVDRTIALTLVISSALGGLAGILYGLSAHDISPYIGRDQVELKGLAVIVVGGMGSITGAVVAGYLLGLIEVIALITLGSNVRTGVAFAVLFLALVLFPSGLFGRRGARRT